MNYLKCYVSLMRKAEGRVKPSGYCESHHIFPKSIYGNNNRTVNLTAREHYIAHLLLWKATFQRYGADSNRHYKMSKAIMIMNKPGVYNSHVYDAVKRRNSEIMKGKTPWNKGIPCSEETKRKSSETQKGKVGHRKGYVYSDDELIKQRERCTPERNAKISKNLSIAKFKKHAKWFHITDPNGLEWCELNTYSGLARDYKIDKKSIMSRGKSHKMIVEVIDG